MDSIHIIIIIIIIGLTVLLKKFCPFVSVEGDILPSLDP
jgi:hypothetical protein